MPFRKSAEPTCSTGNHSSTAACCEIISVSRVKILGKLFGSGTLWKRPPPASAIVRKRSCFTPSPRPTVVTVIDSAIIACTRSRMPCVATLAVGEQDHVLARARTTERSWYAMSSAPKDLGAAAGLDALDVVLDAASVARRLELHVAHGRRVEGDDLEQVVAAGARRAWRCRRPWPSPSAARSSSPSDR